MDPDFGVTSGGDFWMRLECISFLAICVFDRQLRVFCLGPKLDPKGYFLPVSVPVSVPVAVSMSV